jgi:hypothetical protein
VNFYLAQLVRIYRSLIVFAGLLALISSTGCGSSNWSASQPPPSVADVTAKTVTGASTPPVLLFVGSGTSSGDVAAVKTILGNLKLSYATATSSQRNATSETALKAYKLFLMPGAMQSRSARASRVPPSRMSTTQSLTTACTTSASVPAVSLPAARGSMTI